MSKVIDMMILRHFEPRNLRFKKNGQVKIPAQADLSAAYRELLRKKNQLPERTLERVRATLSLDAFKNRKNRPNG